MKNHSGGSHNSQAVPDQQMGRFTGGDRHVGAPPSSERKTAKRVAAKKRRQRDHKLSNRGG